MLWSSLGKDEVDRRVAGPGAPHGLGNHDHRNAKRRPVLACGSKDLLQSAVVSGEPDDRSRVEYNRLFMSFHSRLPSAISSSVNGPYI